MNLDLYASDFIGKGPFEKVYCAQNNLSAKQLRTQIFINNEHHILLNSALTLDEIEKTSEIFLLQIVPVKQPSLPAGRSQSRTTQNRKATQDQDCHQEKVEPILVLSE